MSRNTKAASDRLNTHLMRDCRCPFMQEIRGKRISCEGPMDNVKSGLQFESAKKLDKHAAVYCCKNYRYCEIYRMVMAAKYEE